MKTFLDLCCSKCKSDHKKCKEFIACAASGPLCHKDDACSREIKELNERLRYQMQDRPAIFIGMGTCGLASGALRVKEALEAELVKEKIDAEIVPVGCIGLCAKEPIVDVKLPGRGRISYAEITPRDVPALIKRTLVQKDIFREKLLGSIERGSDGIPCIFDLPFFSRQMRLVLKNCGIIDPRSIDQYIAHGGFHGLDRALRILSPEEVIKEISLSGLRGRGGAGFPTGKKWEFAFKQREKERYFICNADEGDPGAFMDRSVLESDPFRVIEGMCIGAYAIGASKGVIYCRAEYPLAIERLRLAIDKSLEYGLLGDDILGTGFNFNIIIKKGAGAFVCGEETALISSVEGKRGMPKPRPPYPAISGLFGKPTVINNVETNANIPTIITRGAKWFSSIGTETSKGTKVFALSGKVKYSGLVEVPMGMSLRELVFDIGGGIPDGKKFKAVQIGGPSGACLPETVMDTRVDYEDLKTLGAIMGSGGFVVMDENSCMVDVARFFIDFIASESCGKCVPCREGTRRMLEILERIPKSYEKTEQKKDELQRFKGIINLERLANVIKDTALCGLGQTAANPVISGLKYFRQEYETHLFDRSCPAGVCKELLSYQIDPELCIGCGLCMRKCPAGAIVGAKSMPHSIIETQCIRCGRCVESCRFEAVKSL